MPLTENDYHSLGYHPTMAFSLSSGKSDTRSSSVAVKAWARKHLDLENATLIGSELTCTEPGCPPIETVIAVVDSGDGRMWKLHMPMNEVTEEMIASLDQASVHRHE